MAKATVWWNGPSVKQFYNIPPQPLEIGCNFISNNRTVHHVCAYDQPTIRAIGKNHSKDVEYWTRRMYTQGPWKTFTSTVSYEKQRNINGYCSGTMALILAVQLGATEIDLLGCDWTITNNSMYDKQYTWRKFPPTKHNREKFKLFDTLAQLVPITVVHDQPRDILGTHVKWLTPKDYLAEH